MLSFNETADIYIKPGATDMRKSINTLIPLICSEMKLDPFSKAYFIFCGRSRKLVKVLYWDATGFALWMKKLEKATFPWPNTEEEAMQIQHEEIKWVLKGIDFFKKHEEVKFSANFY